MIIENRLFKPGNHDSDKVEYLISNQSFTEGNCICHGDGQVKKPVLWIPGFANASNLLPMAFTGSGGISIRRV